MAKLLPYPQNKVILEELWLLLGFNSGTELREELKDELSNEKVDLRKKFKDDPIALNKALTTYLKGTGDSSVNGWFNGTSQPNYQPFSIAIKRVFNASNRDCTIKNESDLEPYIKAITDKKKAKNSRYIVKNSIPPKIQINIPYTNNRLFGREDELAMLDKAWGENQSNIIALKAFGGTGKTALMKRWLNDLALDSFREADKVYAVSFYSQGAAEGKQASADEFFDTALKWFNYQGDLLSSARDKGLKLAELVNQQRTLLVLDGLEPVQYPETAVMDGALRDAGLKALFEQLAMHNKGLLLISSRQNITELNDKPAPLVIQHMLDPLSVPAGIELFKATKLKGSDQEFADAIYEVNGHALSLNLLAKYLITYEDGDIRQRTNLPALTDFPEETRDTRHALKVMAAYEKQLEGTTELQVLYMMGLFDRPVSAGAIQCLRDTAIEHISDTRINNKIFKAVTGRLREQNLLNKENPDHPSILDTHPLVREYFGRRLKQQYPDAYQLAHKTLYIFYKELPVKELPDTLNEMEPLFAAVAHGCASGLHQEALVEVYWPRIRRKKEMYLCIKLGSFGSELAIVSHFFDTSNGSSWQTPAQELTSYWKASVYNWLALALRALGRLEEALEVTSLGLEMRVQQKNWVEAAQDSNNLSELQLILGNTSNNILSAIGAAKQSVLFAERSGNIYQRIVNRTTLGDTEHQGGHESLALEMFKEAEKLQKELADFPWLYSLRGFRYCDLLLAFGKWKLVKIRAAKTLEWAKTQDNLLLTMALDQLSLGRAYLQQSIYETYFDSYIPIATSKLTLLDITTNITRFESGADKIINLNVIQTSKNWIDQSISGLRKAGVEDYTIRGLLVRSNYYRWLISLYSVDLDVVHLYHQLALKDLQEVYDIAERGGMSLLLTDYYLESARLALTIGLISNPFPLSDVNEYISKARQLIFDTRYKRRLTELEYLEELLESI